MSRSRFVTVSLIFVLCLSLVFVLWNLSQRKETRVSSIGHKPSSHPPLKIKGLSYSKYNNDRLIARLDADELTVSQRRFWVFNILPFNEAILTNARLELHLYENKNKGTHSDVDLLSSAKSLLSVDEKGKSTSGAGLVTRVIIDSLVVEMYKADRLSMLIKAKKAYINFKRKKIDMKGVSLEDVFAGKLIKSESAIWDNESKVLKIPGEYTTETPEGITAGRRIEVDVGFYEEKGQFLP